MFQERRVKIWELTESLYVQLQTKKFDHPITSSQLVKHSLQLAEEFYTMKELDLEKHMLPKE